VLDLRRYFNGTLDALWRVHRPLGQAVVKRFTVVMDCRWQGDDGVLDEDFTYSDGTAAAAHLAPEASLADGRYTGRADDVVGEARARSAATPSTGPTPGPARWTGAS
jgi:hypothetical protein